jgi:ribosomal protein S3AE
MKLCASAKKKRKSCCKKNSEDFCQRQVTAEEEMKEIRREFKKQMKELSKQIGGLGNKFGSFTEGLALPSMTKILAKKFGMTTINPSVRVRGTDGIEQEIDVLAYTNGSINTAVIVEVKSHLREEGIEQLLKQCRDFPVLFPELADKKLYGILAAVDASQAMQQRVLAQGLYFAKIHDEQFSLCVPDDFVPVCFTAV